LFGAENTKNPRLRFGLVKSSSSCRCVVVVNPRILARR